MLYVYILILILLFQHILPFGNIRRLLKNISPKITIEVKEEICSPFCHISCADYIAYWNINVVLIQKFLWTEYG